jgi:hypothetical protein
MMVNEDGQEHQGQQLRFSTSLRLLNRRVDRIPLGWQRLYVDLRANLCAIACDKRRAISIAGGYEQDGFLRVDSITDDKVVQGILRTARMAAVSTCMSCGKPGKPREIGERLLTLCGRCTGCIRLRGEVLALLAKHQQRGLDLRETMSGTALLAAAIQAAIEAGTGTSELPNVGPEEFAAWLDALLIRLEVVEDTLRV